MSASLSRAFPARKLRPSAKVRLVCFPYAGGGASVFRNWQAQIPGDIEVCAFEPPGRETRFRDPICTTFDELVGGAVSAILGGLCDKPIALFGHSLGARVAFEVARRIAATQPGQPLCLIASGTRGPGVVPRDAPIHALPHAEFVAKLRELEGTPTAVLENPELLEIYEPILRADFMLSETYRYEPGSVVTCPVSAYGGIEDKSVTSDDVGRWREIAGGSFAMRRFPGNHFFLHKVQATLLEAVARDVFAASSPR